MSRRVWAILSLPKAMLPSGCRGFTCCPPNKHGERNESLLTDEHLHVDSGGKTQRAAVLAQVNEIPSCPSAANGKKWVEVLLPARIYSDFIDGKAVLSNFWVQNTEQILFIPASAILLMAAYFCDPIKYSFFLSLPIPFRAKLGIVGIPPLRSWTLA